MSIAKNSTLIGILGYGERLPEFDAMLTLANNPAVHKLAIFWNKAGAESREILQQLARDCQKISVFFNSENLGSAGGYAQILEHFHNNETTPFLLLLDDDLLLDNQCIDKLVTSAMNMESNISETLYLAYRPGLPEIRDLVENKIGIPRPRNSCCVGFHFLNLLYQHREPVRFNKTSGLFEIDSAPWGGLFVSRPAIEKLGLPRKDFFLYAEDSELTYRFTLNGGRIILVPDAKITDTDKAWNTVGGKISNLRRRVLWLPETKVFHEVRNRNYIARHYYPGFLPVYWINKFLFLASTYFIGIVNGKFSRALLIHQAIHAGEKMAANEAHRK
ncbi:MAG: glycosyltransferase [Arenimonas sp.]